jgi:16S rRNA (cytidine1402-2'-O)-methyltransferase
MSPPSPGTLYLIPSSLGDSAPIAALPEATLDTLRRLDHLVVETPKQARRFLKAAGISLVSRQISFSVLDEHTRESQLPELLAPAIRGSDIGVLTDAGCPGVADPGARLVDLAHRHGVPVAPLVGPSAILLALMGSGLNGQRFAFHGYVPIEATARSVALKALEQRSRVQDETQILIEAPYRNNRLLRAMLDACAAATQLCIATDLTLPSQSIATRTIDRWRSTAVDIDKRPTVFLLYAG